MVCEKHKKYKVILPPRCDCDACWEMYKVTHGIQTAIRKYLDFHTKGLTKKKKVV